MTQCQHCFHDKNLVFFRTSGKSSYFGEYSEAHVMCSGCYHQFITLKETSVHITSDERNHRLCTRCNAQGCDYKVVSSNTDNEYICRRCYEQTIFGGCKVYYYPPKDTQIDVLFNGAIVPANREQLTYFSKDSNSVAWEDLRNKLSREFHQYTGAYVKINEQGEYLEAWVTVHTLPYSIYASFERVI